MKNPELTTYRYRPMITGMIIVILSAPPVRAAVEPLPSRLEGAWRITRILPTSNESCWTKERAASLVGSTLAYHPASMSWQGGSVPVDSITSRSVSDAEFRKENTGSKPATFAQLGITAHAVTEINMQHEDQEITGSSTEVPGDSILLAGPNRIVVSACGVYMEATRGAAAKAVTRQKPHR